MQSKEEKLLETIIDDYKFHTPELQDFDGCVYEFENEILETQPTLRGFEFIKNLVDNVDAFYEENSDNLCSDLSKIFESEDLPKKIQKMQYNGTEKADASVINNRKYYPSYILYKECIERVEKLICKKTVKQTTNNVNIYYGNLLSKEKDFKLQENNEVFLENSIENKETEDKKTDNHFILTKLENKEVFLENSIENKETEDKKTNNHFILTKLENKEELRKSENNFFHTKLENKEEEVRKEDNYVILKKLENLLENNGEISLDLKNFYLNEIESNPNDLNISKSLIAILFFRISDSLIKPEIIYKVLENLEKNIKSISLNSNDNKFLEKILKNLEFLYSKKKDDKIFIEKTWNFLVSIISIACNTNQCIKILSLNFIIELCKSSFELTKTILDVIVMEYSSINNFTICKLPFKDFLILKIIETRFFKNNKIMENELNYIMNVLFNRITFKEKFIDKNNLIENEKLFISDNFDIYEFLKNIICVFDTNCFSRIIIFYFLNIFLSNFMYFIENRNYQSKIFDIFDIYFEKSFLMIKNEKKNLINNFTVEEEIFYCYILKTEGICETIQYFSTRLVLLLTSFIKKRICLIKSFRSLSKGCQIRFLTFTDRIYIIGVLIKFINKSENNKFKENINQEENVLKNSISSENSKKNNSYNILLEYTFDILESLNYKKLFEFIMNIRNSNIGTNLLKKIFKKLLIYLMERKNCSLIFEWYFDCLSDTKKRKTVLKSSKLKKILKDFTTLKIFTAVYISHDFKNIVKYFELPIYEIILFLKTHTFNLSYLVKRYSKYHSNEFSIYLPEIINIFETRIKVIEKKHIGYYNNIIGILINIFSQNNINFCFKAKLKIYLEEMIFIEPFTKKCGILLNILGFHKEFYNFHFKKYNISPNRRDFLVLCSIGDKRFKDKIQNSMFGLVLYLNLYPNEIIIYEKCIRLFLDKMEKSIKIEDEIYFIYLLKILKRELKKSLNHQINEKKIKNISKSNKTLKTKRNIILNQQKDFKNIFLSSNTEEPPSSNEIYFCIISSKMHIFKNLLIKSTPLSHICFQLLYIGLISGAILPQMIISEFLFYCCIFFKKNTIKDITVRYGKIIITNFKIFISYLNSYFEKRMNFSQNNIFIPTIFQHIKTKKHKILFIDNIFEIIESTDLFTFYFILNNLSNTQFSKKEIYYIIKHCENILETQILCLKKERNYEQLKLLLKFKYLFLFKETLKIKDKRIFDRNLFQIDLNDIFCKETFIKKEYFLRPRDGWTELNGYYNEKFGCTETLEVLKKLAQSEMGKEVKSEENGERRRIANFLADTCILTDTTEYIYLRDKFLSTIKQISKKIEHYLPVSIMEATYIMQAAQVYYNEATRKEKPRFARKKNIERKISKLVLSKDLLEKARKQEKLFTSETKILKKIMREFNLNLSSVTDLSEALVKKNKS
ncbi:hypothetical protein CWI36_0165p0050, partial [Hamiltosporidium magnivora]